MMNKLSYSWPDSTLSCEKTSLPDATKQETAQTKDKPSNCTEGQENCTKDEPDVTNHTESQQDSTETFQTNTSSRPEGEEGSKKSTSDDGGIVVASSNSKEIPECEESEEEKIQELMGRSDTAVIFPEPVSDHEEQEENGKSRYVWVVLFNEPVFRNLCCIIIGKISSIR